MKSQMQSQDWSEIAMQLKRKFNKLTDENIDALKGSLDLLSAKLQSVYGYAKDQAEKEYEDFKATLHEATAPKSL